MITIAPHGTSDKDFDPWKGRRRGGRSDWKEEGNKNIFLLLVDLNRFDPETCLLLLSFHFHCSTLTSLTRRRSNGKYMERNRMNTYIEREARLVCVSISFSLLSLSIIEALWNRASHRERASVCLAWNRRSLRSWRHIHTRSSHSFSNSIHKFLSLSASFILIHTFVECVR